MRRRSLLGDFPPGKFQAEVGVEGDHSGSNMDWGGEKGGNSREQH